MGLTTLCDLYNLVASYPISKSRVSVTFLLLMAHEDRLPVSGASVINVGISKAGYGLPAKPIFVYPVPLSMTTVLLQ